MSTSVTFLGLALLALGQAANSQASSERAVRWEEPILVAAGPAHQGPWRMNESDFRYVDDPTVAVTRDGGTVVAWVDQARKDVFLQRYDPAGKAQLPDPVNVSRSSGVFSWLPRVVVTGRDPAAVYVLWQEIIFSGGSHGGDILLARSLDGGRTFEEPHNLSRDRAGSGKGRLTKRRWHNGSLDLASGGDGSLYASWTDYEGDLWLSRSTDGGETFSEPLSIADDGDLGPARAPSLVVQDAETVLLAWSAAGSGAIHMIRSQDGGATFGKPRVVHRDDGHADAPKLLVGGSGALHLFFARSSTGTIGNYHEYQVVHARLDDREQDFSRPVVISREPGSKAGAGFPSAALGRQGRLHVIWERFPNAWDRPRGLGHSYSDDGGRSWAAPYPVSGTIDREGINGSLQGLLMQKVSANENGDVAVVNSTFRLDEASYVWLLRSEPFAERSRPRSMAKAASIIFSPASSNTTVISLPR